MKMSVERRGFLILGQGSTYFVRIEKTQTSHQMRANFRFSLHLNFTLVYKKSSSSVLDKSR